MRPREEIEFLTLDVGVDQAARRAVQSRHTRLAVRERGLDAPVGLVHAHDLLAAAIDEGPVPLHRILRPLARVPASLPVTELLKRIREERREMVLAADDHGATVGLVTLEDLLEELDGEIKDEPGPAANGEVRGAVPARHSRGSRPGE
jgi:putative hemolysin